MVEISSFSNGASALAEPIAPNEPVLDVIKSPLGHLDAERGVFVTSNGKEIEMSGQNISSLMLERITNEGKPKIPKQEVLLLGKHKELQANPNDPGYLALLAEWQEEQNVRVMRYMFCVGAKATPPPEFVEVHKQFMPLATDLDFKYLWITSLVPDEDIESFSAAILGKTMTTVKGLEEAANFSASVSTETQ